MPKFFIPLLLLALLWGARGAAAAGLVSADWLQGRLGQPDLLVIDASFAPRHAAAHIPGAVNVDVFAYAARPPHEMAQRLQQWGVSTAKTVVVYDEGASYLATRVWYDLLYLGFPAGRVHVLDGGLAKWRERGGAVTQAATPVPARGEFRLGTLDESIRIRLPEFIVASGDPNHALVEALEPGYHFGAQKFFDRAGHVPNARMMPAEDFFNADKTFKSAAELTRMFEHLGIRRGQPVSTYCGGGVAASVPFFALKAIAGYPQVKLYPESQREWLRDERRLPLWTYGAPYLVRDAGWLASWNARMLRAYGASRLDVLDVRRPEAYTQGHIAHAVNVPAEVLHAQRADPQALAATLEAAGIDPAHEVVIVSDGGFDTRAALAFAALESFGHPKLSILGSSIDEWLLAGHPLTQQPTRIGTRTSPQDLVVPRSVYAAPVRAAPPPAARTAVRLPASELANRDGSPRPAQDLWNVIAKAGVPRYVPLVASAETAGDAALTYVVLRLMGFADVTVQP
jgi:thiosulfate/3-mercaptopyruvate sulfurtransferase